MNYGLEAIEVIHPSQDSIYMGNLQGKISMIQQSKNAK